MFMSAAVWFGCFLVLRGCRPWILQRHRAHATRSILCNPVPISGLLHGGNELCKHPSVLLWAGAVPNRLRLTAPVAALTRDAPAPPSCCPQDPPAERRQCGGQLHHRQLATQLDLPPLAEPGEAMTAMLKAADGGDVLGFFSTADTQLGVQHTHTSYADACSVRVIQVTHYAASHQHGRPTLRTMDPACWLPQGSAQLYAR